MKNKAVSLIIFFILSTQGGVAHTCPFHLEGATQLSLVEFINEATNANWVWVGESHSENSNQFYFDLISKRGNKSKGNTCLILEADRREFSNKLKSCDATNVQVKSIYSILCGPKEISIDGAPYIGAAMQLGYRIEPVDELPRCRRFEKNDKAWMNCRNHFMYKRILSLVKSQSCQSGVLINGWEHLVSQPGVTSLDQPLASLMKGVVKLKIDVPFDSELNPHHLECGAGWKDFALPFFVSSKYVPSSLRNFDYVGFLPEIPDSRSILDFPRPPADQQIR